MRSDLKLPVGNTTQLINLKLCVCHQDLQAGYYRIIRPDDFGNLSVCNLQCENLIQILPVAQIFLWIYAVVLNVNIRLDRVGKIWDWRSRVIYASCVGSDSCLSRRGVGRLGNMVMIVVLGLLLHLTQACCRRVKFGSLWQLRLVTETCFRSRKSIDWRSLSWATFSYKVILMKAKYMHVILIETICLFSYLLCSWSVVLKRW